jgi:hypothetical protein
MTQDESLLDEVIFIKWEALQSSPRGDPCRASFCESLALSLRVRSEVFSDTTAMAEAIDLTREALSITLASPMTRNRASKCGTLSRWLWEHFEESASTTWLDESIALARQFSSFFSDDDPERVEARALLAKHLQHQFELTGDQLSFSEACNFFSRCITR